MIVVSNTGPLIALANGDQLSLLDVMFGYVLIPTAVHRELLAKTGPEAMRIDEALRGTLRVHTVDVLAPEVEKATRGLGAGEQEAIALAVANHALLLLDDQAGRVAARVLGLRVTGVVGVLLEAKRRGLIPSLGMVLRTIRERGYWLSDSLIEFALAKAGEG